MKLGRVVAIAALVAAACGLETTSETSDVVEKPRVTAIGKSAAQKAERAQREAARKLREAQSKLSSDEDADDEASAEDKEGLLDGGQVPPPNLEPTLTFSSRYLPEFILSSNSTAEDYYDYFATATHEEGATCDDKEIESFAKFSNVKVCSAQQKRLKVKSPVKPRNRDLAYMAEIEWFPRVSRTCSFRMGSDFRNGGGILSDNEAVFARPGQDLRWGGDWDNSGVITARQLFFSKNQWHKIMFVGISKCCDSDMSIQMDCGDGWEDVTIASVKHWQMAGWGTDHLYMSLNRGHGQAAHSVVETGSINFGDQQSGWHMWEGGHDETHFYRPVVFGTWFPFTPQVEVFIRRLDVPGDSPTRTFARVLRVTSEGFVLDIATTPSSSLYQVGISWIAYTPDALRGTRGTTDCYIGQEGVDNWTLDAGGADTREFSVTKKFENPLQRAVKESVAGFNLIDADKDNVSFDTRITALDKRSYDLRMLTAHGSRIHAIRNCLVAFTPRERQMESGELALSRNTAPSWYLNTGKGLREFRMWVPFKEAMEDRPDIVVTVTGLDIEGPTRFDAEVSRAHLRGFELRVTTWGNTRVHGMRVRYLATVPGRRFRLDGHGSDGSHKCTCADAKENKAQDALLKAGKITAKSCECLEDVHGDRSPVYQNFALGFGGSLEFMKGAPKQKPLFFAMKRRGKKNNKDIIPLYLYVNSKHQDRLYTTKWFKPNKVWRGGSIAMYVLRRKVPGAVPLFRFYDPARKRHRYSLTTDFFRKQSKLWVMRNRRGLRKRGAFRYEGIQCYVFPASE